MSKFVVAIFPSEAQAEEGSGAIRELDSEGVLSLYAMGIVSKDEQGNVTTELGKSPSMPSAAMGGVIGGLIGLLGGPIGFALGLGGGAWVGTWRDMSRLGVSTDFVEKVASELTRGRSAVIAEIDEDHVLPLDERIEELGGVLIREWRSAYFEGQLAREASAYKAEMALLESEREEAEAERTARDADRRARLSAHIEASRDKLQAISERAKAEIEALDRETDQRLAAMQRQADKASDAAKARIEQRIEQVRAERDRRVRLLEEALDLADEALS